MSSFPEGLSVDSLDLNIPATSALPTVQDDQWSDAHDTVETDDERDAIDEIRQRSEDLTIRGPKVSSPNKSLDISSTSPASATPRNSHEQDHVFDADAEADASSVRSMPIVQVTEPASPTLPMTAPSSSSRFPDGPSAGLTPRHTSHEDRERRRRHRTTLDTRSANRFSGFLSSLIHRWDQPPPSPSSVDSKPTALNANTSSRASTPPPTRIATPPPVLPPPNLRDLGLNLSSLTAHISPSHFQTPPTSGAFLNPHYLLLCHAQGLDVLPLVSPPAIQPYALIRRVPFKSVVVMEHRGVLVAIAGRRDGVRVYALEEVKRAVEWRLDVELRRERERQRREEAKRGPSAIAPGTPDEINNRKPVEKQMYPKPSANAAGSNEKHRRKASVSSVPPLPISPLPRAVQSEPAAVPSTPVEPPPPYNALGTLPPSPRPGRQPSLVSLGPRPRSRSRQSSVNNVLAGTLVRRPTSADDDLGMDPDAKGDWASSDDEAINVVASTAGSQALDERTSVLATAASNAGSNPRIEMPRSQTAPANRRRPTNLNLGLTRAQSNDRIVVPTATSTLQAPPSPTPTLLTLRQALLTPPPGQVPSLGSLEAGDDGDGDVDEEEDGEITHATPTRERITLVEALLESRLPDLPPAGTQRPQAAVMIGSDDGQTSPRTSESHSMQTRQSIGGASARRRRRWSVLDGIFQGPGMSQSSIPSLPELPSGADHAPAEEASRMRERAPTLLTRSSSTNAMQSVPSMSARQSTSPRPSTATGTGFPPGTSPARPGSGAPDETPPVPSPNPSRFARIISNAFSSRRSDDPPATSRPSTTESRKFSMAVPPPAPAPKLEYVKLPGTKGALMVKAVETAKKSFLAILCGDNGEKVELFAGTYRTALGLSRTFILPDSPRLLELQLQGDDLVEVFLVFGQNVFGLEPATVRVREVRIGRAERRAARRRARETSRLDQPASEADQGDQDAGADEETLVNVTVTAAVAPQFPSEEESGSRRPSPSPIHRTDSIPATAEGSSMNGASTDELISLATAQMSPYTTFQQLSFAANFPLATIADEYIIPPTYNAFLKYRSTYEPEVNGTSQVDLSQVQFSPPGLPVPTPGPPCKWLYRDPKGIIHGPWKASLMQAWYKDGLLPPDLPVRREEDVEFTLLKDLRLQSVDPTHPFHSSPPPPSASSQSQTSFIQDSSKPLLSPISLLAQPRHFGPPALFYSSRGGHSTTIVDARGRSVLKGRFIWTADDTDEAYAPYTGRLGDVRRLEAFDIQDRAVLIAMRQGGLEAVDFGDALLRPADHSRTVLPHFQPPLSNINRRAPYVWKIGNPLSFHPPASSHSLPQDLARSSGTRKKQSTGPAKSPGRTDFSGGDLDPDHMQDEVLFLGRKDNEMYLCERQMNSFRILRLSPTIASS